MSWLEAPAVRRRRIVKRSGRALIGQRIEIVGAIERRNGDAVCLDPVGAALQRFLDDVREEAAIAFRCVKLGAAEQIGQLLTHLLIGRPDVFIFDMLSQHPGHAATPPGAASPS
ncbi:MAG TPA: hypothetical protein VJ822_02355 [Dongiaceae bacterium]|nr:hypothetical protein [Dongiaceae bacterium]